MRERARTTEDRPQDSALPLQHPSDLDPLMEPLAGLPDTTGELESWPFGE